MDIYIHALSNCQMCITGEHNQRSSMLTRNNKSIKKKKKQEMGEEKVDYCEIAQPKSLSYLME